MSNKEVTWINDKDEVKTITNRMLRQCELNGGILDGEQMGDVIREYLDEQLINRMKEAAKNEPKTELIELILNTPTEIMLDRLTLNRIEDKITTEGPKQ